VLTDFHIRKRLVIMKKLAIMNDSVLIYQFVPYCEFQLYLNVRLHLNVKHEKSHAKHLCLNITRNYFFFKSHLNILCSFFLKKSVLGRKGKGKKMFINYQKKDSLKNKSNFFISNHYISNKYQSEYCHPLQYGQSYDPLFLKPSIESLEK